MLALLILAIAQPEPLTYTKALAECKRTSRPMVVWVGMANTEACEERLKEFVHVHVDRFELDTTPRVIVGIPMNDGTVLYKDSVRGSITPARIRDHEQKTRRALMPIPKFVESYSIPMMRGSSRSC